jgi:uncharacterized protein YjbI with pentapeptide repeats
VCPKGDLLAGYGLGSASILQRSAVRQCESCNWIAGRRQTLDLQTLDLQTLDLQTLDLQTPDLQTLDLQALDLQALDLQALDLQATSGCVSCGMCQQST